MSKGKQETKQFFLYSGRIISRIGLKNPNDDQWIQTYGFYRSTGMSSQYSNTWFPMCSIASYNVDQKLPEGTIRKPGHEITYLEANGQYREITNKCFDPIFLKFVKDLFARNRSVFTVPKKYVFFNEENPLNSFLSRFGNMECMCLSYLIGGGYWNTAEAQPIRRFIESVYQEELAALNDKVTSAQLKHFQTISTDDLQIENDPAKAHFYIEKISQDIFKRKTLVTVGNYHKPILTYEITLNKLLHYQKAELLFLCDDYNSHLEKRTLDWRASHKVVNQKKIALSELQAAIKEDNFDPNELNGKFISNLSQLEKNSDNTGIFIFKCILTVLTLGGAAAFGLWKSKGSDMKERLQDMRGDSEGTSSIIANNHPP